MLDTNYLKIEFQLRYRWDGTSECTPARTFYEFPKKLLKLWITRIYSKFLRKMTSSRYKEEELTNKEAYKSTVCSHFA